MAFYKNNSLIFIMFLENHLEKRSYILIVLASDYTVKCKFHWNYIWIFSASTLNSYNTKYLLKGMTFN